jgi:hypothetical protein
MAGPAGQPQAGTADHGVSQKIASGEQSVCHDANALLYCELNVSQDVQQMSDILQVSDICFRLAGL